MKKLFLLAACLGFLVWNHMAHAGTFTPAFTVDYQTCGTNPTVSGSAVTFGSGTACAAGRVVSTHGYTNIT